jgi:anti-sigma factor RsiW
MMTEQLEFLLSQYADGTLPAEQRAEVELRLAEDEEARSVLAEYRKLDEALVTSRGAPAVQWDEFAAQIGDAVARSGAGLPEELEFQIAQLADGTLDGPQSRLIEQRISEDSAARLAFGEYERLDAILKSSPLPEVHWDKLHAHLSDTVARETEPAESYPMFAWIRSPMRLAMAASILLAIGISWRILRPAGTTPLPHQMVATAELTVSGPQAEIAAGKPEGEVTIGPPPQFADAGGFAQDVVSRPPSSIVASGVPVATDISDSVY